MPSGHEVRLEVAHVLFMDVVRFSKLPDAVQAVVQIELTRLVESLDVVSSARSTGYLIARPSGDGMSLVFFQNLLAPVRAAVEIDRFLKQNNAQLKRTIGTEIHLRMGIHTGPVYIVTDINGAMDVAGDGIVMARRVMDAGDAEHILISEEVATSLSRVQPWVRFIRPLGTYVIKHDFQIQLFSLAGQVPGSLPFGREDIPSGVSENRKKQRERQQEATGRFRELERRDRNLSYFRSVAMMVIFGLLLGGPRLLQLLPAASPSPSAPPSPIVGSAFLGPAVVPTRPLRPRQDQDGKTVRVPNLIGRQFDEAQRIVGQRGLKLDYSQANPYAPDRRPYGTIIRQSDPAGSHVDAAATIYVTISNGSDPGDLPQQDPQPPEPDEPVSPAPAESPDPAPFTGILIEARHLPEFDSRGPFFAFDEQGYELSHGEYRVYEEEKQDTASIRAQVGDNPFRCRAESTRNATSLNLSKEQAAQWREIARSRPDIPVGILCKKR